MIFDWFKRHRRSAVLVGLTLLVPLYLFFSVLAGTLAARSAYQEDIDRIEPRIARMRGLVTKEPVLREALAGVNNLASRYVYPASTDAAAVAASLQAEARNIVGAAGMEVTNSQVLPPRQRDQFDYVAVKVVARGSLGQLEASLDSIARFRPVIFTEAFDVFPNQRSRRDTSKEQLVTVTLQLLSLRSVQ